MSNELVRIILVDDHELVRISWKLLLETNPLFELVADADNGHTAIEQAQKYVPDILLVDINMSPLNGFEVTEKVVAVVPSVKVIGLSVHNQPHYAWRLLELGGRGYFTKTSPLEEIHHGIMEVYKGERYICREVKRHMTEEEIKRTGTG